MISDLIDWVVDSVKVIIDTLSDETAERLNRMNPLPLEAEWSRLYDQIYSELLNEHVSRTTRLAMAYAQQLRDDRAREVREYRDGFYIVE